MLSHYGINAGYWIRNLRLLVCSASMRTCGTRIVSYNVRRLWGVENRLTSTIVTATESFCLEAVNV